MVLPVSRARSCTRRRNRPNRLATGTMRSTIIVSRSSLASRSISSATERRASSPAGPRTPWLESCANRLCTITSSPTRSISTSSRSAGTRTLSCAFAGAALALRAASPVPGSIAAGVAGVLAAAPVSATNSVAGAISACVSSASSASIGTMSSVMSSITKMNTSSISAREASPRSSTCQPRWHWLASSSSSDGIWSVCAVTFASPSDRSSSNSIRGLVPLVMQSVGRRKVMRQPAAAGAETGAAADAAAGSAATDASAAPIAWCRRPRISSPTASSPAPSPSTSACM